MITTTRIKNVGTVKIDLDKITRLREILERKFITQVGVLGVKAAGRMDQGKLQKKGGHAKAKTESDMSNADIGLVHEKGSMSRGIPRRSFLFSPLVEKAEELMTVRKRLWDKFIAGDQSDESLRAAYRDLGIKAENIVHKAFDSGGFGTWQKDSDQTIARKKSSAILIDTHQLERSIDSRVATK